MIKLFKVVPGAKTFSMADEVTESDYIAEISERGRNRKFFHYYTRQSSDGGKTWQPHSMLEWLKSKNPKYKIVIYDEDNDDFECVYKEDSCSYDINPDGSPELIYDSYNNAHYTTLSIDSWRCNYYGAVFRTIDNGVTWHYYDGSEFIDGSPAWTTGI